MKTLYLNLKGEYFDQIKAGEKKFEYRLVNKYWKKRLFKPFDEIVIMRGYPKKDDTERRITRPWRGLDIQTITHEHFGVEPVKVFAIRVN